MSQLKFTSLPLWRLCSVHGSFSFSSFQHYNIKPALISMFCVVLMFPRSHGILRGCCQLWSRVWTQVIHPQFNNICSVLTEVRDNLFWTCTYCTNILYYLIYRMLYTVYWMDHSKITDVLLHSGCFTTYFEFLFVSVRFYNWIEYKSVSETISWLLVHYISSKRVKHLKVSLSFTCGIK